MVTVNTFFGKKFFFLITCEEEPEDLATIWVMSHTPKSMQRAKSWSEKVEDGIVREISALTK